MNIRYGFAFALIISTLIAGVDVQADDMNLSASDITKLHSMGVKPEYIRQIKELGYPDISTNDILKFHATGVKPEYIKQIKELGYSDISANDITKLHSVGVKPEYIRQIKDLGYTDISASDIIKFHATGVKPEYVRQLKDTGLQAHIAVPPVPPRGSFMEKVFDYAIFTIKIIVLTGLLSGIGYLAYRYRDRLRSAQNRAEATADIRLASFEQRVNDLQDILLSINDRLDRRLKHI